MKNNKEGTMDFIGTTVYVMTDKEEQYNTYVLKDKVMYVGPDGFVTEHSVLYNYVDYPKYLLYENKGKNWFTSKNDAIAALKEKEHYNAKKDTIYTQKDYFMEAYEVRSKEEVLRWVRKTE